MRVAGIDPGTKSIDVAVLEGDSVVAEESVDTLKLVEEPKYLVEVVESLEPQVVGAPSGYGAPPTWSEEVIDQERFNYEVLLLSSKEAVDQAIRAGVLGAGVYKALADVNIALSSEAPRRYRVLYLPAVVHLPTVPWWRKVNRIDMGTVDKLASAFLATYEESLRGIRDLVVLEAGFGYYGIIAVKDEAVVDGIGGTNASLGTLTAGAVDFEVVTQVGSWSRFDMAAGGIVELCGTPDLGEMLSRPSCFDAANALLESMAKDVARVRLSSPRASTLVVSGRYSGPVAKALAERLKCMDVVELRTLSGASRSKHAAQGYAAMAAGLVGVEPFASLAKSMRLAEACGTAVDGLVHPKARGLRERVIRAYVESVRSPRLCS